jgi:hypothetical protein
MDGCLDALLEICAEEDSDDDDDDEDFDTEDEESDFLLLHGRSWTTQEQIDWRERHDKLCRRHQQQQQDTVVELGIPMAVLMPAGMGLNGGPSAVTALKKVRADRKCCCCRCYRPKKVKIAADDATL